MPTFSSGSQDRLKEAHTFNLIPHLARAVSHSCYGWRRRSHDADCVSGRHSSRPTTPSRSVRAVCWMRPCGGPGGTRRRVGNDPQIHNGVAGLNAR